MIPTLKPYPAYKDSGVEWLGGRNVRKKTDTKRPIEFNAKEELP